MRCILVMLMTVLLLSACGQYGNLYLPCEPQRPKYTTDQTPEQPPILKQNHV